MMKRVQLFPVTLVLIIMLFGVFGCSKNQDRYEDPPWLGGSSIETLQDKGNYTIFLKLMDIAEYTIPITKQLFTLFVPNDEAFNTYFKSAGIASVEDLTKDQARELFTLHVLPNPRSRFQLIYEYLWSELQGPDGEYAALFFRKPTASTSIPYNETVRYYPALKGQQLLMMTGDKLVPLFSKDYFEDFFGDPSGSDYLYMYPGSKWETGHGDMNWGNAMVTESEVRTSSGFIYFIDQVVPPQKNIDQYLAANQDKFGLYYDLMQRFATYSQGAIDDQKRVKYLKNYNLVSNIAEEQGAFTGNEVRMKDMFTAFIPNDQVLQKYLDDKILPTYGSIDSVPQVTLYYILQTQLSRSLGLISKISKSYFNSFGDPLTISKSDIVSQHMCSNGMIYEMNKVLEPNVFTCVPGNLFFDANYSTFLYALNSSNLLSGLSNPNSKVTLFATSNAQLETYNIRYNDISSQVEYRGSDGIWKKMNTIELNMFIQDQVYDGELPDINGEGYIEMSSGNFVHYSNGTFQASENQRLHENVSIVQTIIPQVNNGVLYNVSSPLKSKQTFGLWLCRDKEVSTFKDYLVATKLLDERAKDNTTKDSIPNLKLLQEADYWTGFIPTNAAMADAIAQGLVPPFKDPNAKTKVLEATDIEAAKNFCLHHFVRKKTIFDDGKVSGVYPSNRVDSVTTAGIVYANLKISNVKNALSVTDHSGQVVNVDHSKANILVRKGVAHKISTALKY